MKEVDAHAGPFCLREEKGTRGTEGAGRYIVERAIGKEIWECHVMQLGRCHVDDLGTDVLSPFRADTEVGDARRVLREKGRRR
jgi:hypothetical protein